MVAVARFLPQPPLGALVGYHFTPLAHPLVTNFGMTHG